MKLLEYYYKIRKKEVPYYAKYSLISLMWRPIRKFINVAIIPNVPFNSIRIFLYRLIGYKIGKNVFIGMKCYLDDLEPSKTKIEDDITISYGCYFALHGKNQSRTFIKICRGGYLGMRCNILGGKNGLTIGENAIIGAGSLVNSDIPANKTAVGVPAKIIN